MRIINKMTILEREKEKRKKLKEEMGREYEK